MKNKTLLVSLVESPEDWTDLKILEASLRSFGGEMNGTRMMIFVLAGVETPPIFSDEEKIEIRSLDISEQINEYWSAAKVTAMAQAEKFAMDDYGTITWIDSVCLILNPPLLYRLDENTDAAFRPVHIQNVGLRVDDPLDDYWRGIYQACGIQDVEEIVDSFVDRQKLRAYYNTHAFSVNPRIGLMALWLEIFSKMVTDTAFQSTSCQDQRHRIFLFQAILSTLLDRELSPSRMLILPPFYNYPYNLQSSIPVEKRISSLHNLVSLTYEGRTLDPDKITNMDIPEPYHEFLKRMVL